MTGSEQREGEEKRGREGGRGKKANFSERELERRNIIRLGRDDNTQELMLSTKRRCHLDKQ